MRLAQRPSLRVLVPLTALAALALAAPSPSAAACPEEPRVEGSTIYGTPCPDTIRAPRSITAVFGEGGNDVLYGQRGNDSLFGGEGNDRVYGGIGDDRVRGGPGDDLLSGGFGADSLDGEGGSDFVRGDATIDAIDDTGGAGDTDTLSYATGVTPGFTNDGSLFEYTGFPPFDAGEPGRGRGVFVDLEDTGATDGNGFGNDGEAPAGGGVDVNLEGTQFERVIGTPFPDFIVGSQDAETIYGGGGADVILGEGGSDQLHGGAEGDSCDGDPGSTIDCERGDDEVEPRAAGAIAVGLMTPPGVGPRALYLTGSSKDDVVTATFTGGGVTFALGAGSEGAFDPVQASQGGCTPPAAGQVSCPASEAPDSIVLAGLDGDDTLQAVGFPPTTSVIALGGRDGDRLTGDQTEDALVDGPGNDFADAAGGDDAVPNNAGDDDLHAGSGEDLFVSNAACNGDSLDGGPDRDNANWANFDEAISIDMGAGTAGLVGDDGRPQCPSASLLTHLGAIEDIEGTGGDDTLVGDSGPNQLLGRPGHDSYFAAAGDDTILANSGDTDLVIACGEGWDNAQIDIPTATYADPAPSECEEVEERPKESFRPPGTPPNPNPQPEGPVSAPPPPLAARKPPRDRTPPRTRLLHRPPHVVFAAGRRRTVSFAFAANETGASFRCKLDRGRFKPCRSPRSYRVAAGRHVFRVFAIDRAGNRDRTPSLLAFRVRRG